MLAAPPRGEDAGAGTREGAGRPPGAAPSTLRLNQVQRQLLYLSIYLSISIYIYLFTSI